MMRTQVPQGVCTNFGAQQKSFQFRGATVAREIESCRDWFLTPGATGNCLWHLGQYFSKTRWVKRRTLEGQPKHLTRLLLEKKVLHWLKEGVPAGFPPNDVILFHRDRHAIASHALNWGHSIMRRVSWEDMRNWASRVIEISTEALESRDRMIAEVSAASAVVSTSIRRGKFARGRSTKRKDLQLSLFDN